MKIRIKCFGEFEAIENFLQFLEKTYEVKTTSGYNRCDKKEDGPFFIYALVEGEKC